MKCLICESPLKFKKFDIKEYNFWKVRLHKNQYYLGRCMVSLRRHLEDLFDINEEEKMELFEIVKNLRTGLKKSFNPNLFNYSSLGNITRHVHLHLIPRYKKEKVFSGIKFKDERWGENPSPYNKNFKIPLQAYKEILETIKNNL